MKQTHSAKCSYAIAFHLSPVHIIVLYLCHFFLNVYTNNKIHIVSFRQKN